MKCPQCSADNPTGMRFCGRCATPLIQEQTCPQCGAKNPPGTRFCGQCAAALDATEPEPDAEQTMVSVSLPKQHQPAKQPEPKPVKEKAAQTCPQCGAQNPPDVRFCEQCAAPLEAAKPKKPEPKPAVVQTFVAKPPPKPRDPMKRPEAKPAVEATRTCPQCGAKNPPNTRFCEQCAAPLGVQPADQTCSRCGTANPAGVRFCEQCAAPLAKPRLAAAPIRWLTWLPRHPRVMMSAAIVLVLAIVIVVGAVIISRQPTISKREARNRANLVIQNYPDLEGVEPVIQTYQAEDQTTYGVEYRTESTLQTEDGPVTVNSGVVVTIDGETGEVQTLGIQ
jgi:predicted amidophosphoribosyltransferase